MAWYCPYVRGRQIRRFRHDHPSLLRKLNEDDCYWADEICCAKVPQLHEQRYPTQWISNRNSRYQAIHRWRRMMKKKHPYPYPYKRAENKSHRTRRRQKQKTFSRMRAWENGTSIRRRLKDPMRRHRYAGERIISRRNWNEDEEETTKLDQDTDGQINYSSCSEPEGIDYGVSGSE